jgi:UDP-GlcNAc3NAcA epimerase
MLMYVLSVVGARPQFVKAAAVSAVLRRRHRETLVHTGQHYDDAMSGVFFRELAVPPPEVNLGIGSGPHGAQTGAMLAALENVILSEQPDWVLVYGDTNSTLAGALASAKLGIPITHVEAGLRSFNRGMPEEHNRVVTDHLADLLLAPTATAMHHLAAEGLGARAVLVGDVMVDVLRRSLPLASREAYSDYATGTYALLTVHRASNTDDPDCLREIVSAAGDLGMPVMFPVHPRTRSAMHRHGIVPGPSVRCEEPLPYLTLLALQRDARVILTDSGGIQKEAFLLGVPCVTLRAETEWTETLVDGWNVLTQHNHALIISAANRARPTAPLAQPFGDGHAAERVAGALEQI